MGMSAGDSSQEDQAHVSVVIRLRPPQDGEDIGEVFRTHGSTITIRDPLSRGRSEHNYVFNHIFLPEHGQEFVFEAVALPLIDRLLEGFNSCCFAYGQTGSGKTHSIFGEGNADRRGMLARSIENLFSQIEARSSHKEVGMVVSFTEIYLDQVRDLGRFYMINQDGAKSDQPQGAQVADGARRVGTTKEMLDPYLGQDLPIHESPQGLIYVEDLTLIPIHDIQDVLDVVNLGVRMRATYETRLNARSSRSHTIFTISIVQKSRSSDDIVGSVINFVDLAGSERLAKSQSEGRRFQEAVVINSSLSALGKVVLALASDPKAPRHVPYRDSKLTRILQNSLGGNSYTTLLTTIDPTAVNFEESLNSLSFADRCKNVQNRPVLNTIDAQEESQERMVHRLFAEVATLRHQLEVLTAFRNIPGPLKPRRPDQAKGEAKTLDASSSVREEPSAMSLSLQNQADGGSRNVRFESLDAVMMPWNHEEEDELEQLHSQAMERLRVEGDQTRQAEQRAELAMLELEKARQQQELRQEERRREIQAIRQRNKQLEVEIARGKASIANVAGTLGAQHDSELRMLENHTSEMVQSRESIIKLIPSALAKEVSQESLEEALCRRMARKVKETEDHLSQVDVAVRGGHSEDVNLEDKQHAQWLEEREAEGQRIEIELENSRLRHQRRCKQIRGDLLDTYTLLCQLAAMVDGYVTGAPAQLCSDIRAPMLQLSGLRARLKEEGVLPDRIFEQLSRGLGDLRRSVSKYELSRQKALGATVAPESAKPANLWDADVFAREFCDCQQPVVGDTSTGDASAALRRLSEDRLRALCLALRKRARMSAGEQEAERTKLRGEVANMLETNDRVTQIRQLEKDIADCKVKINWEEGQARHLEIALTSSLRSLSRSRPSSRTSQPSTRPNSAGPRRTTSIAGGAGVRQFSAGPARCR
jgi:hypothetical protein